MASRSGRFYSLFVSNLPWTVGHRELLEYFSRFGNVYSARVAFDKSTGLSRGFGIVDFSNRSGFDNANNKQIHELEGHNLNVKPEGRSAE